MIIKYSIYANIFAEKMWVAFAFAKATHIFSCKNTSELDIILTKTGNILTTNELVKLTMLWTTGTWYFSYFSTKTYVVGTHQKHPGEALLMSTHNICFCGEIRQIFAWYPLLSRPRPGTLTIVISMASHGWLL